ncbi:glycosyltransferase family 2 protein [Leptothoe sp. PORK10 BA2]|uniref:glycosyltransferase family 2 protein n=1 Tax=Leptothoe sp. PORK10 BA2 TaxID=3110254 RepID=UPI002B218D1D|nr:glycosyltransferase family 2 protein [Leptothoe sp. PORK10 BA2]MEA5463374.1 glycosyltransferase family 2 protein [Leptothoe sp. PORK10 BA2]
MSPIQSASGIVSIPSVEQPAASASGIASIPSTERPAAPEYQTAPEPVPELSIVVPMYCEESNVDHLFERLETVVGELGVTYEIICVDDGSKDSTLLRLISHHHRNPAIKVVALARNFGKELALTAGLDHSRGQAVVPIDADLQDPPEYIQALMEQWRAGYDVVYAKRNSRLGETWFKTFSANGFYRVIGRMSQVPIPQDTGDFRLMDRRVVDALKQLPERTRFMKGLFAWVGYRQTFITYDRDPRHSGQTKWNYWKLWNFALDGIVSFSSTPLRVWSYLGLMISAISFVYASFLVIRTLVLGIDLPGYASLMVAILFLGGIQLVSLGIIGEYLGRVYEEVKQRPLYLVREFYGGQAK